MYRSVATPHANCDVTDDALHRFPRLKCSSNVRPYCESLAPVNVYKGIPARNDHFSGKKKKKKKSYQEMCSDTILKAGALKLVGAYSMLTACFANKITHRV